MKYRARNSNMGLFTFSSIDISIIVAMFLVVVLAWGVARMEKTFIKADRPLPVFTISQELSVMPVVQVKEKKDAVKVGRFVSLAKTDAAASSKTSAVAVEKANAESLRKIVLSDRFAPASSVSAPRIIYKTLPDYPIKAIEDGLQGTTSVKIFILKNGRVGNAVVQMSSGYEILDKAALAALSQWIFEPAVMNREATEAWFEIPVKFQLKS